MIRVLLLLLEADVWALGTVFHAILMRERPWYELRTVTLLKRLLKGERPPLSEEIVNSQGPSTMALRDAIQLCNKYLPVNRATARQVETFLKQRLEEIDPGRLQSWGVEL